MTLDVFVLIGGAIFIAALCWEKAVDAWERVQMAKLGKTDDEANE